MVMRLSSIFSAGRAGRRFRELVVAGLVVDKLGLGVAGVNYTGLTARKL